MTRPRNVLVTGADTPVGERLVKALLLDSRIDQILAVSFRRPEDLVFHEHPRLTCLQVDLSRSRKVRDLLFGPARERNIDVVVHTSLHRSAHATGRDVHAYNVEAIRSLLTLGERHPTIRRLIVRSSAAVYQVEKDLPVLIAEDHPIIMGAKAPQWVQDRVEADITACMRMGLSSLQVVVLRMAEILAPGTESQLHDYLQSAVCLRPAGYDPMLNLLSLDDATAAFVKAIHSDKQGVFNIPGADTLPLSACIRRYGRIGIPVPGASMTPLYRLRRRFRGSEFRYGMNQRRFHYSGVLDGRRAQDELGYVPSHPLEWPGFAAPS